jgi:hypothetical protein
VGIFSRPNNSWWLPNSFFKFVALIIASLVVVLTPLDQIMKSLNILKNIGYLMVLNSILYFLLMPFGENFFSSDYLSGHRFNGGINSYIVAGQFVVAGLVAFLYLNQNAGKVRIFAGTVAFLMAGFATNDRTSIVSMLIILMLILFRSGFKVPPMNFRFPKSLLVFLFISASFGVVSATSNALDTRDFDSVKSTLHRMVITLRSYELFLEVLPTGSGPGSQTLLMYENPIRMQIESGEADQSVFAGLIVKEMGGFRNSVGSGNRLSPHNTYFEILIPFGVAGLLFVIFVLFFQIMALKRLLFRKNNRTVILDSYAVSGIMFFMFSSLYNLWWLYVIYYRMLAHTRNELEKAR